MSRNERSVSARASSSPCDRSSSSIRLALSMAIAAWSARAPRRFAWSSPNRPGAGELRGLGIDGEPLVVEIVDGEQRGPPGQGAPDDVLPDPAARPAADPVGVETGHVADRDRARDRVEEVDDRAFRVEEPGRLVGDMLEELVGLADRGDPGRDLAQGLLRRR